VARFLAAEAGVRQFLDIGTGIPAANNTHEVVHAAAPDARIVYVDYDPVVLLHARTLLTRDVSGAIDYIDADLRDPGTIVREAARTLDFSQPVAAMLIAIMHLVVDADDPYGLVAQLTAPLPSGSYLALSQVASDIEPEQMAEAARRYNRLAYEKQRHRTHAEVSRFFDGLELVARVWSPCRIGGRPARSRAERSRLCGAASDESAERRPRGTRRQPPTRPWARA
jgi:S-adenosyl methyltransferase